MAAVWKLKGRVTEDGKLDVELPNDVPPGEVEVNVTLVQTAEDMDDEIDESLVWTEEELARLYELMKPEPAKSGKEIADMIRAMEPMEPWSEIDDPVEWVLKQREARSQRRKRILGW